MGQTASRQFDAQRFVRGLSLGDQLVLGGAVAFVIFSFFPWIGFDIEFVSSSQNGLHGWGILAFLIALVTAGFAVIRTETFRGQLALPALPAADWMLVLGGGVVTVLCTLLYWVEYHSSVDTVGGSVGTSQKFGWYIALLAAIAMTAGGYLKQRDPEAAPTPYGGGYGGGTPASGGAGSYGTGAPPPPAQGGYGAPPPPAQGGYGAPPPPTSPGGYGTPPPPPQQGGYGTPPSTPPNQGP